MDHRDSQCQPLALCARGTLRPVITEKETAPNRLKVFAEGGISPSR